MKSFKHYSKCFNGIPYNIAERCILDENSQFVIKGVDIINGEYPPGVFFKGSQIFEQKNKGSQIFRGKFKGSQINFKV